MKNKLDGKYYYAVPKDVQEGVELYFIYRFDGEEIFGYYWNKSDAERIIGALDNSFIFGLKTAQETIRRMYNV